MKVYQVELIGHDPDGHVSELIKWVASAEKPDVELLESLYGRIQHIEEMSLEFQKGLLYLYLSIVIRKQIIGASFHISNHLSS